MITLSRTTEAGNKEYRTNVQNSGTSKNNYTNLPVTGLGKK